MGHRRNSHIEHGLPFIIFIGMRWPSWLLDLEIVLVSGTAFSLMSTVVCVIN